MTDKLIPSDEEILEAVGYHYMHNGSPLRDRPVSLLEIAIHIAAKHGVEPEWLPGPFGNGVQESDTQRWGRVVSLHRLRKSLDTLTNSGLLSTGTGEEWTRRLPFGTDNHRRRFWAIPEDVERWQADRTRTPESPAPDPLDAVYALADRWASAVNWEGKPAMVDRAFATELLAVLPPRPTSSTE